MRAFGTGLLVVVVLMLANVVAAGIFLVLWPLARQLEETGQVIAAAAIGALAIACALLFLKGFISTVPAWLQARRPPRT